jgi:urease gamma subunit
VTEPIKLAVKNAFSNTTINILPHEAEGSPIGRLFARSPNLIEVTVRHNVLMLDNDLMAATFPDGTQLTTYTRIEE